jgi:magnesium-transporting ATPase (P-type)
MGITGTDVAREAADMVLADDNFASIVNAIEEGRAVFSNIRKFLVYVLASNVAELIPCLCFMLFHVPLPLSVIQILSVDLGTDLVPALALGTEPPEHAVMARPPRSSKQGLFDFGLLSRAYLYLGVMVSLASMSAYFWVLHQGGWSFGQSLLPNNPIYMQATTACLMGIMCMQVINSSLCRSEQQSIFSLGLTSNRLLVFGVFLEICLMAVIVYSPWGHSIFHTTALPLSVWLFFIPFMLGMLIIEETRKWFVRNLAKKKLSPSI